MIRKSLPILILAQLVLCLSATAADLTIVSTVTPSKGSPTTSTQYITPTKIRTSDGRFDTVMDIASGKMLNIDHQKKQYYETSLEEMRAAFAEVHQMLESNPMLAKMFGQAATVQVEQLDGSREIAGYPCKPYRLTIGENFRFEVWAAHDLEPPYQYYDARKFVHAAAGPIASRFDQIYDEMKKLDGFPLATTMDSKMMGMNLGSVTEATEVKEGPIDPTVFEPPAGYKKKKSPYEKK